MAEVRPATRALRTALEGLAASPVAGQPAEVVAALSPLESLESELQLRMEHESRGSGSVGGEQALIDQYNLALSILREATGDVVLEDLFTPLPDVRHSPPEGASGTVQETMASLRMAVRSLKEYLGQKR